ncbi:peptidoglycan-binding domain-containing protein [Sagittula sp. SSi028]|uniref:peptidoglycan-binding domain-containing protein n=1 Tax=Sagittula sp. SSi028 TaxID=3400636 RepID=UPI003AF85401
MFNSELNVDPGLPYGDLGSFIIPGWFTVSSDAPTNLLLNRHNLVHVDGPGGPTLVAQAPEEDATNNGPSQFYLDSWGTETAYAWQYFTPSCNGTVVGTVFATSRHNHNGNAPNRTGTGALSIVPVTDMLMEQPAGTAVAPTAAQAAIVQPLITDHIAARQDYGLPAGNSATDPWLPYTTSATVQAGQTYAVVAEIGAQMNVDQITVVEDCTFPPLEAQDVSLTKTCEAPVPHMHNGIWGQRWDCQVDVTTTVAPFAGDIIVHDVFTNTPLVDGEILLGQSVSGNGSCFAGDCLIEGANFDSSGTESFTFDVFVEATDTADSYPLENCASAEIDDGAGTMTPVAPACTTATWAPGVDVVKTCDPIPEDATAPYTMNCRITVTGSDLVGGSFVSVIDAFAAQPPSVATVAPTFMNVTSTENWNCIDQALNQPSSMGVCELPAADLMNAGGTSTLDITFQFDVDTAPTQVANCRFSEILEDSYIDQASGQRSALRSPLKGIAPQADGWPQMPDGCVYVDVPGPQLETKVAPEIKKSCNQPVLSSHNGVTGYVWQCEANISVAPSPFAGDVSFTDDGSQISVGTSSFISVSEPTPTVCQGLGTDTLSCSFAGASFASPYTVQYELFTPFTGTQEAIEWENCIRGEAVTAAGTFPSVPMCVTRFIKPGDDIDLPPAKEVKLEKICEANGREITHDGETGMAWDCRIEVTASPAPFAGSFTFTEDATAISGSSGQIIGIDQAQPADWSCLPGLPTQSTDCTISGASFDSSGSETVGFTLFAPSNGETIDWTNCASGVYTAAEGAEPQEVGGNCQTTTWKPDDSTPPEFSLKKSCRGPYEQGDAQQYNCIIYVTQTGGDPITQPLTLNELFSSTTTGQSASQYLIALMGTTGWACDVPTASCTIQPADFNGTGGHQIGGFFLIPNGVLAEQDFENCAALTMGDQTVASAPCVAIDEPDGPAFEVSKDCKPLGDRQTMGPTAWFQQMQCTITVTSNGVPFNDMLWLDENMLYGPHDGSQSIIGMTSNDPWECTQPPFGSAVQPACGIQGSQFPHTTSTVDVTLNLFGTLADPYGAENCVALSLGDAPSSDPDDIVAETCTEIVPVSQEPAIDLVKTCAPAVSTGNGQWSVDCELTITGQNLPAGHLFRVTDELMSSTTQTALSGQMNAATNACGGGQMSGGVTASCDLTTDTLNSGSITIPYTGTFEGPVGRPINGAQAMNCAFVDVASLGLHGPTTGNGKSCVPIEFEVTANTGTGGIAVNPDIPTPGRPVVTGPPLDGTAGAINTPPSYEVTKTCAPLVFAAGAQVAQAECEIQITTQNLMPGQVVRLSDALFLPNGSNSVPFMGNFTNITSPGLNWACNNFASPTAVGECFEDSSNLIALGNTVTATWTALLARDDVTQHRGLENCARLSVGPGPTVSACAPFEIAYQKAAEPAPDAAPAPTPFVEHSLTIEKVQTSDCVANRNTQRYSCGFELSVRNDSTTPFSGPLVVTDTFGSPWAQAITQQSQGGWLCAQPVGGAVSCEHAGLTLPPAASSQIALEMEVQGLVNGGQWENCAAVGIPDDRTQRVAAIQQAMNARGLNAGPVDGKPGRKTYAALKALQRSLGLPVKREFDDALFAALGLPLAKPGEQSCVLVDLPRMPKPPLQCEAATTLKKGESCQCRYDNMVRRNATACQCKGGYAFVAGEGCIKEVVRPAPDPVPAPPPLLEETLTCDKRSTRLRGDRCVCIDSQNAVQTSKTTCGCKNGLPMVNGRCLPIQVKPTPREDTPDSPVGTQDNGKNCVLRLNDICLKWQ